MIAISRSASFQFIDEHFPVVSIFRKTPENVGYLRRDGRNWSTCDLSIGKWMLSTLKEGYR